MLSWASRHLLTYFVGCGHRFCIVVQPLTPVFPSICTHSYHSGKAYHRPVQPYTCYVPAVPDLASIGSLYGDDSGVVVDGSAAAGLAGIAGLIMPRVSPCH
jgi:hypothetical protein